MYKFVREDNGKIVEVDFEQMMRQDAAGFITLQDGVRAHRVSEPLKVKAAVEIQCGACEPPISDTLGFTVHQLAEFEEDRRRNGFTGVEFTQDPSCPVFYQVRFSSHKERDKYIRHRGMVEKNRTAGCAMTKRFLDEAQESAKNRY